MIQTALTLNVAVESGNTTVLAPADTTSESAGTGSTSASGLKTSSFGHKRAASEGAITSALTSAKKIKTPVMHLDSDKTSITAVS